jgi:hypothetical protein
MSKELQERIEQLSAENHDAGVRLRELDERLSALEAAHERLRGRFYATRGPEAKPAAQSKAEILRQFGYVPGKPAPHT